MADVLRVPVRIGPLPEAELRQAVASYKARFGIVLRPKKGRGPVWFAYGVDVIAPPVDPVAQLDQQLAGAGRVIARARQLGQRKK